MTSKFRAMLFDAKSITKTIYTAYCQDNIKAPIILNQDAPLNPILLIHGSGDNQCAWSNFVNHLPNQHPIYAFTLDLEFNNGVQQEGLNPISQRLFTNNKSTSIEQYATKVINYIEYIFNIHKMPVILIGMSMGGLIARYCETVLESPHIHHIITLSTPHRGAPLLNYKTIRYFFPNVRHNQMTPQSEFLTNDKFVVKNIEKYTTIGSIHDIHVPNDYATIDGVKHIVVDDCGHMGICHSQIIKNHVISIIMNF